MTVCEFSMVNQKFYSQIFKRVFKSFVKTYLFPTCIRLLSPLLFKYWIDLFEVAEWNHQLWNSMEGKKRKTEEIR